MANIIPFQAIRPRADLAEKIAALPYDITTGKRQEKRWRGMITLSFG